MAGRVYGLERKFRHQAGQNQAKQNECAGPDPPPKIVAAAACFVLVLNFREFGRRREFGVGCNAGLLLSLEAGLPIDFRARNDGERFALFTYGAADEAGNRGGVRKAKKITPDLPVEGQGLASSCEAA